MEPFHGAITNPSGLRVYEVVLKPKAVKDLDNLPDRTFDTVSGKIDALSGEPRPNGCKKLINLDGYRIRAGDYRVLYSIDDVSKTITVTRVLHRKDAYR